MNADMSVDLGEPRVRRIIWAVLFALAIVYGAGVSALVCRCPGLREMPVLAKSALIAGLIIGPLIYLAWRFRRFLGLLFLLLHIVAIVGILFGMGDKIAGVRRIDAALWRGRIVLTLAACQVGMIALALCIQGHGLWAWGILFALLLLNFYLMAAYARWLGNPLQAVVRAYQEYDRRVREMAETVDKDRIMMSKLHDNVRGPVLDIICSRSFLGTVFASSFLVLVAMAILTFAGVFRCLSLLQPASFTNLTAMDVWGYPYFSAVTILTIGYGDIAPHLALARLAVVLEGLTGIALLILAVLTFSVVSVQKWDEYTAQVRSEAGSLSLALSFDPRSVRGTRLNMAELPAKPKSKDSKPGSGSGKTKEG